MIDNNEVTLRSKSEEERKERLNNPMTDEVEMAIDKLRNNRAAGPNNIQAACIKFGKLILLNALRKVIRKVRRTEKIPEVREEGIICPVHKKATH